MSGPARWVNEWVCVCSHTYKNKQILLLFSRPMILTLSQITRAYETFPIKASSEMMLQPLTKADSESEPDNWSGTGSVCFHLSLWMNSQSSCVTLHPAAQHLAWFASKNFVSFSRLLHSKWFLLAIAGRIVMQGGLWWAEIIEEVRQALAVWDTSICLCTHTEEPKNEPK